MSFLLKIVQGPNAGAEIALAEGVNLSVGSSDECDIILNDASIPARAFELEVTSERVVALMEGGKDIKLEPFHVTWLGTTAVAVGPLEGTWRELVWTSLEKKEASESVADEAKDDKDTPPPAPAEDSTTRRKSSRWIIIPIIIVLLLAIGIFIALWKAPEKVKSTISWVRVSCTSLQQKVTKEYEEPAPLKESLEDVARACSFEVVSTNGATAVKGEFKTRRERLEATARAYAAQPGILVDFVDTESLSSAIDELLKLVSDGNIKIDKLEGRKAFLSGVAASKKELRRIMEALSADVPKVVAADCSKVVIGNAAIIQNEEVAEEKATSEEEAPRYQVPRVKAVRSEVKVAPKKNPEMPVIGILTVPYPCLVLADGSRAMEGARFGEFVIEKIEAESVIVRGVDGSFVWRP